MKTRRLVRSPLLWGTVWIAVLAFGMRALWAYALTAGPAARPPTDWPSLTRIERDPARPLLLMFVHPKCACTRASIGELETILSRAEAPMAVEVLVLREPGIPEEMGEDAALRELRKYPNVTIRNDVAGREARVFRAATSGETLFFDTDGKLRFHGGITVARGHLGDSEGREAILSLLRRESLHRWETPTFGCVMFSESGS